jgi:drug/metabolite transporter (DMT)-like permease
VNYLLLAMSVIANGTYNTAYKLLSRRASDKTAACFVNFLISAVIALILTFAVLITATPLSLETLLLGVIFGIATSAGSIFVLLAFSAGEMAYTVLFINASMVIPAFSGALIWDEPISALKIIAAPLIIAAAYFASAKSDKKTTPYWFPYCLAAFVAQGAIGIIQKVQRKSDYASESLSFLLVAFIVSTLVCLLAAVIFARSDGSRFFRSGAENNTGRYIACVAVCGLTLGFCHIVNLYLAGALPSALLFPVQNGGSTVLSVLIALVIFRETPNKRQLAALVVALAALAMLFI